MATQGQDWFTVDRKGLAQLLERRGRAFAIIELVSNAWDERITAVDVRLAATDRPGKYVLSVADDSPDGFHDLRHAFTLFASSIKKDNPEKRGRFNLGEKLVLALCESAMIQTTKGTVSFEQSGRSIHTDRSARTGRGTVFTARINFNKADMEAALKLLRSLIPPAGIVTMVNGDALPVHDEVKRFRTTLQTEIADEEGVLRRCDRKTDVSLHTLAPGEKAHLYELGVPVQRIDGSYHCNVHQKVPLNMERDGVNPGWLRALRTAVLDHTYDLLDAEEASSTWVKDALVKASPEALRAVITQRYGEKAVAYDPTDVEGTKIAVSQGYTVVHGGAFTREEWDRLREAELLPAAGRITPSPSVIMGPDGAQSIKQADWKREWWAVADYAQSLSRELLEFTVIVQFANDVRQGFEACYGSRVLTFNVGRLGNRWFAVPDQLAVDALLLHEFAHERVSDHLSEQFHAELCRLGALMRNVSVRLSTMAPAEEELIDAVVVPIESGPYRLAIPCDRELETLQELVGGFIEAVNLPGPMGATGFINEEGKLIGLPVNSLATELYNAPDDVINGTMVIVGPPDQEGETTSVSERLAEILCDK